MTHVFNGFILRNKIHTYSGRLGALAGDMARSCADLQIPVIFVALISRKGIFAPGAWTRRSADRASRPVEAGRLGPASFSNGRDPAGRMDRLGSAMAVYPNRTVPQIEKSRTGYMEATRSAGWSYAAEACLR